MKKVTDDELKQIQQLRERLVEIITLTGELHISKYLTEKQVTNITTELNKQHEKFIEFQEQERVLFEQLQQKYGTGNISFETGEITE